MPLQDHFRPPLDGRRNYHGFHHAWAITIAFDLNARMPPGYFAEPNVQYAIEINVAAFDDLTAQGERPAGAGCRRRRRRRYP